MNEIEIRVKKESGLAMPHCPQISGSFFFTTEKREVREYLSDCFALQMPLFRVHSKEI